jgi:hypothetical protein
VLQQLRRGMGLQREREQRVVRRGRAQLLQHGRQSIRIEAGARRQPDAAAVGIELVVLVQPARIQVAPKRQQLRTAAPDNPLFTLSLQTHPAPQLRLDRLEVAMGNRLDAFAGKPAVPLSQRLAAGRR